MKHSTWWGWISHFLKHTVIGTVVFLIIATPDVGLSILMHFLVQIGVSRLDVKYDVRLYYAPLTGAYRGICEEIDRITRERNAAIK